MRWKKQHATRATISKLLDRIVTDWLAEYRSGRDRNEDAEQQRLRRAATQPLARFEEATRIGQSIHAAWSAPD